MGTGVPGADLGEVKTSMGTPDATSPPKIGDRVPLPFIGELRDRTGDF